MEVFGGVHQAPMGETTVDTVAEVQDVVGTMAILLTRPGHTITVSIRVPDQHPVADAGPDN